MGNTLHKSNGFTLVEVLCATIVGGAVVALGGLVAVQSMSTSRSVGKELQDRWVVAHILEQFRTDVRSAIALNKDNSSAYKIPDHGEQLLEITGLSTLPDLRSLVTQRLPSRIVYTAEKSENENKSLRFVRRVEPLIESNESGVFREVLAEGLTAVSVDRFFEDAWIERENRTIPAEIVPAGLRLTLRWQSQVRAATVCTVSVPAAQEK